MSSSQLLPPVETSTLRLPTPFTGTSIPSGARQLSSVTSLKLPMSEALVRGPDKSSDARPPASPPQSSSSPTSLDMAPSLAVIVKPPRPNFRVDAATSAAEIRKSASRYLSSAQSNSARLSLAPSCSPPPR